ncbi:hypothetical protein Q7P37_000627 [Cladosporium fusiforme]
MNFLSSRFFWFLLRLAQLLLTILVLGFAAFVINWWNENWSSDAPVSISSMLFCSLITPFALTYLLVVPVWCDDSKLNHPAVTAGIEGTMALIWALSSISTAVMTSERVCFGTVCSIAKAAIALGILEWLAFLTSFILALVHGIQTYRSSYPVIATTYKV